MKREKPPIEKRNGADVDPYCRKGVHVDVRTNEVDICNTHGTICLTRTDFDALVRWYTGTEPKQPRTTKGTR